LHRRTEITIETDRVLIIRRFRAIRTWCPQCGCEVDMANWEQAEALTGMSAQALRDSTQLRNWHVSEGQDGAELICLESLLKST
jgi:hypothetical protein